MAKAKAKKPTIKKTASKSAATKPSKKNKEEAKSVVAEIVEDDDLAAGPQPENLSDDSSFDENPDLPVIITPSSKDVVPTGGQDVLTRYLNEIRKYPVLSREEERKIATRFYETKDPKAGELLVKSNLRFVVKIAAEYARFSNRMIDLIQEGNVGLMQGVKEFNPHKGVRLITYAVWWIRGYIQEYLMRQFSMVRIGTTANQRKLFYQLQRQKEELEKMGSQERIEEIAKELDIPADEVAEMVKRISSRDVSIDKPVGEDDDAVSLGSLLKKEDPGLAVDDQLALQEQISQLKEAIEQIKPSLSEKELIILEERILNEEPLTLQEIGEKYKITREAVRQGEVRLINKIKAALIPKD